MKRLLLAAGLMLVTGCGSGTAQETVKSLDGKPAVKLLAATSIVRPVCGVDLLISSMDQRPLEFPDTATAVGRATYLAEQHAWRLVAVSVDPIDNLPLVFLPTDASKVIVLLAVDCDGQTIPATVTIDGQVL